MSNQKLVNTDYVIRTLNNSDGITLDSRNTVITGDLTVVGNAVLLGNINADRIFNGTSNVEITTPNGNVQIGVGGIADVVDVGTAGLAVSGVVSASGNITAANVNTAGRITATGNIDGGNLRTAGNILIQRNASAGQPTLRFEDTDDTVIGGQILGAIEWYTSDVSGGARVTSALRSNVSSVSGNATVEILTSTNGAAATVKVSILENGNVGLANAAPAHRFSVGGDAYVGTTLTAVGNITGGNLLTAGSATVTGNVTGGNISTAGVVTVTGNVAANNMIALGLVSAGAAGISTTGNVTGGNLLVNGIISASGNLTTTDIFATTLSLTGNVIGNVSTAQNVVAGVSVDTPLVVTNIITSDDSSAVHFNDGIIVDNNIETNASVSAFGNVTGNNIVGTTTVTLPTFADDTARDAAITAPAAGMMIYNIASVKFQGFTGVAWVDLN